jgi:hypothetical protein
MKAASARLIWRSVGGEVGDKGWRDGEAEVWVMSMMNVGREQKTIKDKKECVSGGRGRGRSK